MYVVTDDLLLAFFHEAGIYHIISLLSRLSRMFADISVCNSGSSSACGEDAFNDEVHGHFFVLKQPPTPVLTMNVFLFLSFFALILLRACFHSCARVLQHAAIARAALHGLDAFSNSSPRTGPRRILHITDSRTKSVLLSWPERYHHDVSFEDPLMTPSEEPNCCHCTRQTTTTLASSASSSPSGERLVLSYGSITFSFIHARAECTMQPQQKHSLSLLHMQSDPKSVKPLLRNTERNVTSRHCI